MIYITGDTHGRFERFYQNNFHLGPGDYVIICGDFGGVWNDNKEQQMELDRLSLLPFTILFVDGNHENFDLLEAYPLDDWKGGKVQYIRKNIIHLMRGQVFSIENRTFFTMGGAACHDIQNGVLDPAEPDFLKKYNSLRFQRKFFRVRHMSWWEKELPCEEELNDGLRILCLNEKKVNYIITHCAPTDLQQIIMKRIENHTYSENALTDFLQQVYNECVFSHWFCGHYHNTISIKNNFHVLYEAIIPLP